MVQGHDSLTAEEIAVTARPADGDVGRIEYILSGLATAMATGGICLIDEIGKLRERSLAALAPVLDHRRTLYSALAGFQLRAHCDFRLIATANTSDFATASLPGFMAERLNVRIELERPDRPLLDEILQTRYAAARDAADRFLSEFWRLWPSDNGLPSPRQLIQTCQMAGNLASVAGRRELGPEDVQGAIDVLHA